MLNKKRISIMMVLVLVVLAGATAKVEATTAWEIGTISNVDYDKEYKAYYIYVIDTNGGGWVIDIIEEVEYNEQVLQMLQQLLKGKQIEYNIDNMNTTDDIYDDEIIEYRIIF